VSDRPPACLKSANFGVVAGDGEERKSGKKKGRFAFTRGCRPGGGGGACRSPVASVVALCDYE